MSCMYKEEPLKKPATMHPTDDDWRGADRIIHRSGGKVGDSAAAPVINEPL